MDGTLQRKRRRACLSSCFHQGNSYSLNKDTKRGFFMSSIRVRPAHGKMVERDGPIAPPTRNEDWPCSCEVNRNEGMKGKQ